MHSHQVAERTVRHVAALVQKSNALVSVLLKLVSCVCSTSEVLESSIYVLGRRVSLEPCESQPIKQSKHGQHSAPQRSHRNIPSHGTCYRGHCDQISLLPSLLSTHDHQSNPLRVIHLQINHEYCQAHSFYLVPAPASNVISPPLGSVTRSVPWEKSASLRASTK
jgi:hypothetical protein